MHNIACNRITFNPNAHFLNTTTQIRVSNQSNGVHNRIILPAETAPPTFDRKKGQPQQQQQRQP